MPQLINALKIQSIVPVLAVDDAAQAIRLAEVLCETGFPIMEFTLRSANAASAIKAAIKAVPQAIIGVGSIKTAPEMQDVIGFGAKFLVSPGATTRLLEAGREAGIPYFPGTTTASEILHAYEYGYRAVKFFPAETSGGVKALAALSAPLPEMRFMPTGGINAQNIATYLALKQIIACGGSWMVQAAALQAGDYATIRAHALEAAALKR